MKHTTIDRLAEHVGTEVELRGWLYNRRSKGKLQFLLVRDGTGIVQGILFKGDVSDELFETAADLPQESSLVVRGTVKEDARAPGGFELGITDLQVVSRSEEYPIAKKEHGVSFLMDHRHLWLRSRRPHATLRIRDEVVRGIRDFFADEGYILVDAPIFTPNACEGTSTLFETEYFGDTAYLSQSGQLYMEAAAMALGKVYCFGPTFRAEKSKTRRHLTEFWMVEPEIAYGDLEDVMDLAERFMSYLVARVLSERRAELDVLERDTTLLEKVAPPFPRLTYDEAFDILDAAGSETVRGSDFGGADETIIASNYDRPVMITGWPREVKAFYMKPDPNDPTRALGVDVIAPEGYGEIIGGGQRMDDLEELIAAIDDHGLPQEAFNWFTDLRRYGSVPHGGFGMGLERFVSWVCGLDHLRESIPFPRMMHRLAP